MVYMYIVMKMENEPPFRNVYGIWLQVFLPDAVMSPVSMLQCGYNLHFFGAMLGTQLVAALCYCIMINESLKSFFIETTGTMSTLRRVKNFSTVKCFCLCWVCIWDIHYPVAEFTSFFYKIYAVSSSVPGSLGYRQYMLPEV